MFRLSRMTDYGIVLMTQLACRGATRSAREVAGSAHIPHPVASKLLKQLAREGLLALSARQALYFTINRDEAGRPLEEGCIYEIASPPLAARWWSLTLYAADNFLARNNDHAPSVDATRTLAAADDSWAVRISPVRGETANWISSRAAGRGFLLTLRIYDPRPDFRATAEALPKLTTLSCAPR